MIPIVILAGGKGERLGGGDKPLRRLGGQPLISHILATIRRRGWPMAINANSDPSRFAAFDLPVIADSPQGGTIPYAGPLAGILAGLEWAAKLGAPGALFVPGDCPFVPANLPERLLDAQKASPSGPCCAESGGRFHPVIGIWPVEVREAIRHALAEGEHRVGILAQSLGALRVSWPDLPHDPFFNINTPDDMAEAEARLAMGSASTTLDLLGLKCPLPVLRTRKVLAGMAVGETLLVLCSDPLCGLDIPNLIRESGDILIAETRATPVFRFLIRKA